MLRLLKNIVKVLILTAAGLYLLLFVLLRIPAVQSFIAHNIEKAISNKIGSKVVIGRIDYRPLGRIIIDDAYIYDQKQKKMLSIARISATMDVNSLIEGKIVVVSAQLFAANVDIYRQTKDTPLNCQFLIDSLSSGEKESSPLDLHLGSVIIRNGNFSYNVLNEPRIKGSFSTNHLDISKISANISLNYTETKNGQLLRANLKRLDFKEKSGFICKNFISDITLKTTYNHQEINISNSNLYLPSTHISIPKCRLSYVSANESIDKKSIELSALLNAECIDTKDISSLLPKGMRKHIPSLSLLCDININQSAIYSNISINTLERDNSVIIASLTGNNIWKNVCYDVNIKRMDIKNNLLQNIQSIYPLPKEILRLGDISSTASVNVCRNSYYTKVNVKTTKAGSAEITGRMNNTTHQDFALNIKSSGINLYEILGTNSIGNLSGDININGTISQEIKNISVKGHVKANNPDIRFQADIDTNMDNLSLDNILGKLNFSNIYLPKYDTSINNVSIDSNYSKNGKKISLQSDIATLILEGDISLASLPQSFSNIITLHLPNIPGMPAYRATNNNFTINCKINNPKLIESLTNLRFSSEHPISLQGNITDKDGFTDIMISIPELQMSSARMENSLLHIYTLGGSLNASLQSLLYDGNTPVRIDMICKAENNVLGSQIKWDNMKHGEAVFKGAINTQTLFNKDVIGNKNFNVSIPNSNFSIGSHLWSISSDNISYSGNRLTIDKLNIGDNQQHVYINGVCSTSEQDSLNIDFRNIDVEYIMDLVDFHSVEFTGMASGQIIANSIFSNLNTNAELKVDNFQFQYGDMGTLYANATYNNTEKRINIDAIADDTVKHGKTYIVGNIEPSPGSLDLNIKAENTRLDFMRSFCKSFLKDTDLQGDGEMRLYGPFSGIDLVGELVAHGKTTLISTNCSYNLPGDTVRFIPGDIKFINAQLTDKYGNYATLTGGIHHHHLGSLTYDLHAETKKFLAYDVSILEETDETFCGKAIINGQIDIIGRPNILNIKAKATTLKGTYLTYNVSSPDAIASQDFITWKSMSDSLDTDFITYNKEADSTIMESERTNIRLSFNVNATPDAKLHLIMDAATGDYIDLFGGGELQVNYYNKGALNIIGNYNIDHGIYRMTVQNILRREFSFQRGSQIAFSGDPFNANLHMKAMYQLNSVSLSDLNIGTSFKANNVPVDCIMNITGLAGQPHVDFNLDLPTLNNDAKEMVYSVINSEEAMNQQVLYLLAIGRFYSNADNRVSENEHIGQTQLAMQSLLSGTFSQQLNQVLSQLIDNNNWSFGANIATGTDGMSNAEYEGILNGRLLNNRLLFNGQFGYRDNIMKESQSFIGDFTIQYLLTPNGNISVKMYNQSNDRYFTRNSLNTQGVGIVFKKEFGK